MEIKRKGGKWEWRPGAGEVGQGPRRRCAGERWGENGDVREEEGRRGGEGRTLFTTVPPTNSKYIAAPLISEPEAQPLEASKSYKVVYAAAREGTEVCVGKEHACGCFDRRKVEGEGGTAPGGEECLQQAKMVF